MGEKHHTDEKLCRSHLAELLLFCPVSLLLLSSVASSSPDPEDVFSTSDDSVRAHVFRLHCVYSLPSPGTQGKRISFLNQSAPLRHISNIFLNPQVCYSFSALHLGVWMKERCLSCVWWHEQCCDSLAILLLLIPHRLVQ